MEIAGSSFIGIAIAVAAVGGLGTLLVGYIVFRMLKKSVKMALRFAFAAAVLVALSLGAASVWWYAGSGSTAAKPAATKKR